MTGGYSIPHYAVRLHQQQDERRRYPAALLPPPSPALPLAVGPRGLPASGHTPPQRPAVLLHSPLQRRVLPPAPHGTPACGLPASAQAAPLPRRLDHGL